MYIWNILLDLDTYNLYDVTETIGSHGKIEKQEVDFCGAKIISRASFALPLGHYSPAALYVSGSWERVYLGEQEASKHAKRVILRKFKKEVLPKIKKAKALEKKEKKRKLKEWKANKKKQHCEV